MLHLGDFLLKLWQWRNRLGVVLSQVLHGLALDAGEHFHLLDKAPNLRDFAPSRRARQRLDADVLHEVTFAPSSDLLCVRKTWQANSTDRAAAGLGFYAMKRGLLNYILSARQAFSAPFSCVHGTWDAKRAGGKDTMQLLLLHKPSDLCAWAPPQDA